MELKQTIGWIFIVSGISLIFLPIFSDFTGYFVFPSTAAIGDVSFEIINTIAGFALAFVGYFLIKSNVTSALE